MQYNDERSRITVSAGAKSRQETPSPTAHRFYRSGSRSGELRIAVLGLFHGTNIGNEATLEALLRNLQKRHTRTRFICISPPGSPLVDEFELVAQPIEPLPVSRYFWRWPNSRLANLLLYALRYATEPKRFRLAREALLGIDMLLIPGTGVLADFGQGPLDMPTSILRWVRAAKSVGARVLFVSVGAGPIIKRGSRRRLLAAAALADSRSFRDEDSRNYMASIGLDTSSDSVIPDLAFSLAPPPSIGPKSWPPRTIGIGIMQYYGWHETPMAAERIYAEYMGKITAFISWLARQGYTVRLLIGDTRADTSALQHFKSQFVDTPGIIASRIETPDELVRELQLTDVVVASRYHNLLLALLAGKPTISLGYSQKCESLMTLVGLQEYSQDIEQFTVEGLKDLFQKLAGLGMPPTEQISRACRDAAAALELQFDQIIAECIQIQLTRE